MLSTDVRRELYEAGAFVEDAVAVQAGSEFVCPSDCIGEVIGTVQRFGAMSTASSPSDRIPSSCAFRRRHRRRRTRRNFRYAHAEPRFAPTIPLAASAPSSHP